MNHRDEGNERLRCLMAAAQEGDRGSYNALLKEVAPLVRCAVRRKYRYLSDDDAEDVVQDVLLSLHTVRGTYDTARPFMPWLMAIVHNRTVDSVRRYARRAKREVTVAEYPETFDESAANTVDESYGDAEALRLAVAGLPKGQRMAIEMVKFREMSLKEASGASGMSVAALKVAVHRATKALRVVLAGSVGGGD